MDDVCECVQIKGTQNKVRKIEKKLYEQNINGFIQITAQKSALDFVTLRNIIIIIYYLIPKKKKKRKSQRKKNMMIFVGSFISDVCSSFHRIP